MSRPAPLGGQRMGKRARAAETKIATEAAFGDARLPTREQLEATIRSGTANADEMAAAGFPRAAARAREIVEHTRGRLERREYRGARGSS